MFKPCTVSLARVSIDSRYAEEALRGLSGLRIGDLLESEDVSDSPEDYEILDRCFRLQHTTETLLDFVRFHNPEKRDIKKAESLSSCPYAKNYASSSFRQRMDFLDKCLREMVNVWGLDVEAILALLEKDVVLIRSDALVKQARKMDMRPKWLASSKSVYAFSGLANKVLLARLQGLLSDVTRGEFVLLSKQMPEEYEGRFLVTVVTLKEYRERLEKHIGLITCDNPDKIGYVYSQLALIDDLAKKELSFALQMKRYFGTLSPLQGVPKGPCFIEAWVPKKDEKRFREYFKGVSSGTAKVDVLAPQPNQVPPILLANPRLIKPFEAVLEMFGLPDYDEMDPTPIIALTIPLFFGLMFGDVGHGALVVFFGLLVCRLSKEKGMKNIGCLAISCGIASIIMGFLYGSFFSPETGVLKPLWMELEISIEIMLMILCVGIVHMSLGLLIGFINAFGRKHESRIEKGIELANYVFQLLMFFGLFALLSLQYTGIKPVYAFLIGLFSFLLPLILMPVVHALPTILRRDMKTAVGDMLLGVSEFFHIFMATISNTISYLRILILAFIHEVSGELVFELSTMASEIELVGTALGYLIFAVGTAAILAEGFIVFIQSMRLHYYEFFSKFYSGGGVKYETLHEEM